MVVIINVRFVISKCMLYPQILPRFSTLHILTRKLTLIMKENKINLLNSEYTLGIYFGETFISVVPMFQVRLLTPLLSGGPLSADGSWTSVCIYVQGHFINE